MPRYRMRLTDELSEDLNDLAEAWGQPRARLVRLAIEDLLTHQERLPVLLAGYLITEDTRTPEQIVNGERYIQELMRVDLEAIVAQLSPHNTKESYGPTDQT
jgi:predicted DNA-binding protein